jgi:hypothetical protein
VRLADTSQAWSASCPSGCSAARHLDARQPTIAWTKNDPCEGTISEAQLAILCSEFGIDSDDPTTHARSSLLLSPAGIAGIALAALIALLCAAALIGELSRVSHADSCPTAALWQAGGELSLEPAHAN